MMRFAAGTRETVSFLSGRQISPARPSERATLAVMAPQTLTRGSGHTGKQKENPSLLGPMIPMNGW